MEAGSVLRAGPAAGHIVVTHTVCELVSMEMGQKALLHTKADLAVLRRGGVRCGNPTLPLMPHLPTGWQPLHRKPLACPSQPGGL